MKAMFLLLVLANASFFLWEIREQKIQSSQKALRRVVSVGEPILLVAERPATEADEALSAATDLPASALAEDARSTSPAYTGFVGPPEPLEQTATTTVVASASNGGGDLEQAEGNEPADVSSVFESEMGGPPPSQTAENDAEGLLQTPERAQPADRIAVANTINTLASTGFVGPMSPGSDDRSALIASGANNALINPQEELAVNEPPDAMAKPAATENRQRSPQCREFGPFDNEQVAGHWRAQRLFPQGAAVSVVSDERETLTYFVYYPAAETFAQSRRNLAMLENMGIQDLWLFRSGPKKGIISLGLFNRKMYATRYVTELATRGLMVEMGEMKKVKPVFFVKVVTDELNFQEPPWNVGELCTEE